MSEPMSVYLQDFIVSEPVTVYLQDFIMSEPVTVYLQDKAVIFIQHEKKECFLHKSVL